MPPSEMTLASGMKVFYLRKSEATFTADEVGAYFKIGVQLQEGATVFDVGANIGIFMLSAYERCHHDLRVYAFEPIPAVFHVLQQNAQRDLAKLKVFPYGLSCKAKIATFVYYPQATLWSSADPNFYREQIYESKTAILRNLDAAPGWFQKLPRFLQSWVLYQILDNSVKRREYVECSLKTLSDTIRECQVQQIDLLKIDVEKGELDVLLGIEPQDWSKIQQVVLEVHDSDSRLQTITALLTEQGLNKITLEQQPILKSSNVFLLYARRE